MLNKFIYNYSIPFIVTVKRTVTVRPDINLGQQMKKLNDDKQYEKALNLFDTYKEKSIEKNYSLRFTQALKACIQIGDLQRGLNIYKHAPLRMKNDSYVLTSLIHLYMQCNDVRNAQSLFNISTNKTSSMYEAMMKGYIKNNQAIKAIELFNEIKKPDEIIVTLLFNACAQLRTNEALILVKQVSSQIPKSFHRNSRLTTCLLDALVKCGDFPSAEEYFSTIDKSLPNYEILMSEYIKENNSLKILELFKKMNMDGIQGDLSIYLNVIKASAQIGSSSLSQSIAEQIPKSFRNDDQIQNVLIDMWGKSDCIDKARETFESIKQPDQIGYTAMINSYGLNGMGIQAVELFHQMPSKFINEVTYICILNACSHSGLVENARSIFKNCQIKTEKIYTAMIDCLGRAALFEEVHELIDEFERHYPPLRTMYLSFLSAARNEKNTHSSRKIFDRMKKFFPELIDPLTSASILLANVYASSGQIDKASNIKIQLNKSGAKRKIGLSRTAINGQLYQFRAHDRSHPRSKEIYVELEKISNELTEHGHIFDSSWITRPLSKNETVVSVLSGHSERLAIAWNFVENPKSSIIQVTNNLRMCGDCHRATKLIASIRQCEIIIRDANRIHHFYTNGQCSCNDYF